jgi:hypothetical protein
MPADAGAGNRAFGIRVIPLVQTITLMIEGNPLARLWEGVEGISRWGRIRTPFPARINFSGRPRVPNMANL